MDVKAKEVVLDDCFLYNGDWYKRTTLNSRAIVRAQDSGLPCIVAIKLSDLSAKLIFEGNSVKAID